MVLNTCTYQLSRVKQSLCLSWTGMDEKIQSAITSGFVHWLRLLISTAAYPILHELITCKNSSLGVGSSMPCLRSKVNLFGKLL